jgi:polyhydroxyalkanoate synthesis regulator phasin
MQDFLKRAFNLGLGALVVTKEKVEEIVDELVKKGEVGQEEGEKLVSELIKKGEESKKEVGAQIEKIVKGVIEKLDISTRKELDELRSKIEGLKEKLNKEE